MTSKRPAGSKRTTPPRACDYAGYRLVAWVHFEAKRCFVKSVLTHAEYDKGNWK